MQTMQYLSSPAGAGKTRSLVSKAFYLEGEERSVLFVQPTIELIDQTDEILARSGIFTAAIHKNNSQRPVAGITKYLIDPYPHGHTLFITQSSLERIRANFDRSRWDLIVDEIPNVTQCFD